MSIIPSKKITFRIFRFNTETDYLPTYINYDVDVTHENVILDILTKIKNEVDGSLSYRRSCRHGICGICSVKVNGKAILACKENVLQLVETFGEELIIDNAEKALTIACLKTEAQISEYTAAPLFSDDVVVHQWLIEFEKDPDNLDRFVLELDNELKKINSDYDAKRTNDFTLKLPIVHAMPNGVFYRWLKSKDKLGGQFKIPRLANSRWFIEELKELQITK